MVDQFDPYYIWLGIPPHEQPPNHYRILGIPLFTSDSEVIENAADRQMSHLRTFQIGEQSELSQKLLNEVSAAWVCLKNTQQKTAYDQQLRQKMMPPQAKTAHKAEPSDMTAGPDKEAITPQSKRSMTKVDLLLAATMFIGIIVCGALLVGRPAGWSSIAQDNPTTTARSIQQTADPSSNNDVQQEQVIGSKTDSEAESQGPDTIHNTDLPDHKQQVRNGENSIDSRHVLNPDTKLPSASEVTATKETTPSSGEGLKKLAVPTDEAKKRISDQLRKAHNLNRNRGSHEKIKLAGELFDTGNSSKIPDEKYVFLKTAAELAAEGGNVEWALSFVDAMAANFDIDPMKEKIRVLKKYAVGVKTSGGIENLIRVADRVTSLALAEERYDLAAELADVVYRACGKTHGKQFRKQALERRKETFVLAASWKKLDEAREKLKNAPGDPQANLVLGKTLCFEKNDWQQGLAHLAKSSDEDLKKLAGMEIDSPPSVPQKQIRLGDAWWDLAQARKGEEKEHLSNRARYWYEKALPNLPSGMSKIRTKARISKMATTKKSPLFKIPPRKKAREKPDDKWTVLFCSSDPRIWNTDVNEKNTHFALPVARAPWGMKYLRMRCHRGGALIIELRKDKLKSQFSADTWVWDGSTAYFANAHHLGIYRFAWRADDAGDIIVSTSKLFRGWGFGHIAWRDTGQGYTWAGEPIPPTIFEISVTADELAPAEKKLLMKAKVDNRPRPSR